MSAIVLEPAAAFPRDAITKTTAPYVSLKETGYGSRRKAVFTFRDCVLPVVDNAGVGGQICNKLFALPDALVLFTSSSANLTIERHTGTDTALSLTWDGDFGIGTATGVGSTLATTEQNIMLTRGIPQAVNGKATFNNVQPDTPAFAVPVDGSAGTVKGYLNILVDDADQDASVSGATVKINGTITLHYEVQGKAVA